MGFPSSWSWHLLQKLASYDIHYSSLNIRLHSSVWQCHVFLDSYKHLRRYVGNHLPDYMASQPGRPVYNTLLLECQISIQM